MTIPGVVVLIIKKILFYNIIINRMAKKKNLHTSKYIFIWIVFMFLLIMYKQSTMIEIFDNSDDLFQELMSHFTTIFPSNNRNAGGVQFFEYILNNIAESHEDFKLYNTFFCSVSGSPIHPNRQNAFNYIVLPDLDNNLLYGKFYRCCSPCVCDIARDENIKVEIYPITLNNITEDYYVMTINDPCSNMEDIPSEVTSFTCENNQTQNGIHTESGRLIIGILHDAEPFDPNNSTMNTNNETNESQCLQRNNTPTNELVGGMGDIFVVLSEIG